MLAVVDASNHVQNLFIRVLRVGWGQVKRREGHRVSNRASLVIRHKFQLRYACYSRIMTFGLLVFYIGSPTIGLLDTA